MSAPPSVIQADRDADWRSLVRKYGSVVVMATADMNAPLWTNKQHVAVRVAEEVPTLYIESLGLRAPRLSLRDLRRAGRRLGVAGRGHGRALSRELPVKLQVVSPLVAPFHGLPCVRAANKRLLRRQLQPLIEELPRPQLLWTYSPLAQELLDLDAFDTVVYHCVDDLTTVPRMPVAILRTGEEQLARRADANFASAPALAERLSALNPATYYTPNVADWDHFSQPVRSTDALPWLPPSAGRPRAVFIGALTDYKIDWALLRSVAQVLHHWSFVFIGPVGDEARMTGWRSLDELPNVHFVGPLPYADLPAALATMDVALLPYSLTEHTRSVFPLKTMEYLATGTPVVATPLESLTADPTIPVSFASTPPAFAAAIEATDRGLAASRRRREFARGRTWDAMLADMFGALCSPS